MKNTEIQGIQIIGTQRSGSNLLRLMLNQFDEIAAPHPPHILQTFFPLLEHYDDLSDVRNAEILINDICKFVALNPVPWRGVNLNKEDVLNRCFNYSLVDIFKAIYEIEATTFKTKFWCCKSMSNVYYLDELEEKVQPYYIYLYRDGRDVALSFKNAIVGDKHIYFLAKTWAHEQKLALDHLEKVGSSRAMMISYEQLISEPEYVFKRICSLLNLKFNNDFLKFYKSKESKITAQAGEMWSNLTKPIMSENSHKFVKGLTEEEISIFESVAGELLIKLGYELTRPFDTLMTDFDEQKLDTFSKVNDEMKKTKLKNSKPEDIARRMPQMDLINEIKSRLKKAI